MDALFHLGVKLLIQNTKGEILLVHRVKNDVDYWDFPGGKVNKNEALLDALSRELDEEIGFSVFDDIRFYYACQSTNILPSDDDIGLLLFVYRSKPVDKLNINLSPEHDDYKWHTIEESSRVLVKKFGPEFAQYLLTLS